MLFLSAQYVNKMEWEILEAIYHVKSISKKIPFDKIILPHIQKYAASSIYLEVIEETVSDMVAKKIMHKDFRILSESFNLSILPKSQMMTMKLII